jgi:hypothetical protein
MLQRSNIVSSDEDLHDTTPEDISSAMAFIGNISTPTSITSPT